MDNYQNTLKHRIVWILGLDALALAVIIITGIFGQDGTSFTQGFIRGFQIGIFAGLQGFVLFHVIKYFFAIRDEGKLKALKIAENDERAKFIRDKIGGGGFNFSIAGVAVGTVAAGFYSQTIFFTLLTTIVFMVLVKGALKIYYNTKY